MRLLARQMLAEGAPCVVVDPDPDNLRARRAYAQAGFAGDRLVQTPDGMVVLMVFK
jgi:aminoglycoside 6'-N-acetyltransferase